LLDSTNGRDYLLRNSLVAWGYTSVERKLLELFSLGKLQMGKGCEVMKVLFEPLQQH
jgi:hypothetical protein